MLSRNLKRSKKLKTPNSKRKKIILSVVLALALFFIIFGIYKISSYRSEAGGEQAIKVETGDRPLKKSTAIFVNADGGLSLRKDRDAKSERLALIPNKTQLEATEELDGWYKVTYNGKTGWIAKEYTTVSAPAEDPAKGWSQYINSTQGYKIKYPLGWKFKDYGANAGSGVLSLVAFSNQDLPATIPQGSEFIAPITVQVNNRPLAEISKNYSSISGVVAEKITIAGTAGTKYTYTSTSSNTQMTDIVFSLGGKTFILGESGGYSEDLLKMANTFGL